MSKDYDPKEIEPKWQKIWAENGLYNTPDSKAGKDNEYILVEFAYPSGNLHVGHWYAFSVPDIHVRYRRMQGKNVLYPMGFDAFGLPAENAAIKNKLNPREWTFSNIDYMRNQLRSMGASFDWSREVITASPEYYKWTQWLFLKFLEKGLAYQSETPVNWCPGCKTVLANEQVVAGECERCGTTVEKRNMLQWNLKITDYADRLVNDLESLDWPKPIKEAQKNWIGRSEGAEVSFQLSANSLQLDPIRVFTTRPDTIFGATYLVLAPEHELISKLKSQISNLGEIEKYLNETKKKTDIERSAEGKEKTGVELKGVKAVNPATGEEIPVWIADYVLPHYGTGAIMAVPAHDERDFEFAQKFNLPIKEVVIPECVDPRNPPVGGKEYVERKNVQVVLTNSRNSKVAVLKWKKHPWTTFPMGGIEVGEDVLEAARREVLEETGYKNLKNGQVLGGEVRAQYFAAHKDQNRISYTSLVKFELDDEDREELSQEEAENHEVVWMDMKDLTTEFMTHAEMGIWLERLKGETRPYTGDGVLVNSGEFNGRDSKDALDDILRLVNGEKKVTYKLRDWVVSRQRYWGCPIPVVHCAECGVVPVPESAMPVVLPEIDDYLPSDDGKSPLAKASGWVSVKCPKCGADAQRETDTLDTFIDSSWYYLRYTDSNNTKEFAAKEKLEAWMPVDFYSGGAEHTTMHLLYSRFFHKVLFDMGLVGDSEPYKRRMNRGLILGPDGQKMSKSKGNVIDPDKEVERLGADTVRMYLAFVGPYNEVGSYPWNPDAAVGVRRFLERVWRLKDKIDSEKKLSLEDEVLLNQTIKKVSEEVESMKMNTAVSSLMILTSALDKQEKVSRTEHETLVLLLAPFAPHVSEELWAALGHESSVHTEAWPAYDSSKLESEEVTLAVQINGKVRGTLLVSKYMEENEIKALALHLPEVEKWLAGQEPKRVIVVPGKIVSIVTGA